MIRKLLPTTSLLCIWLATSIASAKTIDDYMEGRDDASIYKSVKIEILKGNKRGEGPGPYWPAMEQLPPRIALVTVYLIDEGLHDRSVFLPLPSWSTKITEQKANAIAGFFEQLAVPMLKEELADRGIELLTPDDFLQTDEQLAFYRSFEPQYGMVVKSGMKWMDKLLKSGGNPEMATAPGYRMFPTNLIYNDKKGANSMHELAEKLGVDAVMGIAIRTRTGKKETQLVEMAMNLYGPNPIPPEDRKGMKMLWYEGQPYGSATVQLKKINILEYTRKKDETQFGGGDGYRTFRAFYSAITTYASLDGLDRIAVQMARKLMDDIEKRRSK